MPLMISYHAQDIHLRYSGISYVTMESIFPDLLQLDYLNCHSQYQFITKKVDLKKYFQFAIIVTQNTKSLLNVSQTFRSYQKLIKINFTTISYIINICLPIVYRKFSNCLCIKLYSWKKPYIFVIVHLFIETIQKHYMQWTLKSCNEFR